LTAGSSLPLFYEIHIFAVICLSLSIFACLFILANAIWLKFYSHTFVGQRSWKSIGHRFPIYLAITDLLFVIEHSFDHWLFILRGVPESTTCNVLAAFLTLTFASNVLMVVSTAFYCYLLVVWEKRLDLGRYDWKLWVFVYSGGVIILCIGYAIHTDTWGQDLYFCATTFKHRQLSLVLFFVIPLASSILICAFCYYKIARKTKSTHSTHTSRTVHHLIRECHHASSKTQLQNTHKTKLKSD